MRLFLFKLRSDLICETAERKLGRKVGWLIPLWSRLLTHETSQKGKRYWDPIPRRSGLRCNALSTECTTNVYRRRAVMASFEEKTRLLRVIRSKIHDIGIRLATSSIERKCRYRGWGISDLMWPDTSECYKLLFDEQLIIWRKREREGSFVKHLHLCR